MQNRKINEAIFIDLRNSVTPLIFLTFIEHSAPERENKMLFSSRYESFTKIDFIQG